MGVGGGRSKNDTCVALTKFEKNTDVFFSQNLVSPHPTSLYAFPNYYEHTQMHFLPYKKPFPHSKN